MRARAEVKDSLLLSAVVAKSLDSVKVAMWTLSSADYD